jgi:hypothetical protein
LGWFKGTKFFRDRLPQVKGVKKQCYFI